MWGVGFCFARKCRFGRYFRGVVEYSDWNFGLEAEAKGFRSWWVFYKWWVGGVSLIFVSVILQDFFNVRMLMHSVQV